MRFPVVSELRTSLRRFIIDEGVSWRMLAQPLTVIDMLIRHRFLHFLVVGGGGAVLGLGITWSLTTFIFGLEHYFSAYLIGTAVALAFNFTMYSLVIFRTSREHIRRLAVYFVYITAVILVQAATVKIITPFVGLKWYLAVIASVVAAFSILNFLVFKLSIFNERTFIRP